MFLHHYSLRLLVFIFAFYTIFTFYILYILIYAKLDSLHISETALSGLEVEIYNCGGKCCTERCSTASTIPHKHTLAYQKYHQ